MEHYLSHNLQRIAILVILLLIGIGCTATPGSLPSESSPVANLTAKQGSITLVRGGNSETELQADNSADIQVDDQIKSNEDGQGLLRFQDHVEVELFQNTEIHLADAEQESGGSTFVRLFQTRGQARVRLNDNALARVTLETDYETINTLEEGTEFVVCQAPGKVTCQTVDRGSIEVTAQGKKEIVRAGHAAYVKPGQPPSSPICILQKEYQDWLEKLESGEEGQALGALVASWPQEPCSSPAQASSTPAGPRLPSSQGMVQLESGLYEIGSSEPDDHHIASQEISMQAYWIDEHEVTNAQYQAFLDASGHAPPTGWPGEAEHPVKGITWDEAAAYCQWLNKRLPTEAEWEVAARGPGANPPLYPWGNDPLDGGKVSDLPRSETYGVGSVSFNQSPFGVYDMAGNVWEWVGDPYGPVAEGEVVLRGGRYGYIKDMAYREAARPDDERFVPFAGIRCAADQIEGG